ncbi:hypothetical protein [Planktothrix sp. FACHB-1355]|nr:hypothetical protein [Planktothrix sp. FACHB-1355]
MGLMQTPPVEAHVLLTRATNLNNLASSIRNHLSTLEQIKGAKPDQILTGNKISQEAAARQLFEQYQRLSSNFDPALLNLYDPTAKIYMTVHYSNGQMRRMNLSFENFRQLMLTSLPLARTRGDRNTYSQVRYRPEGNRIRITAQRYSHLYRNTNPHSMLVGPNATGKWVIFEEAMQGRR